MYKFILSVAFLFSSTLYATSSFNVKPLKPLFIPIDLSSDVYLRGNLKAHTELSRIELIAPNGEMIRKLGENTRSVELRLLAEESGAYQIKIVSQTESDVSLVWQQPIEQPAAHSAKKLMSARLDTVQQATERQKAADALWLYVEQHGAPLVEYEPKGDAVVTFLWRGAKHNVKLFGAPFGSHQLLTRLEGTDIWYKSYRLPTDSLMTYQFAPDIPVVPNDKGESRIAILATKQKDPLNSKEWHIEGKDKYASMSVLQLKDAHISPYLKANPNKSHTITQHQIESKVLKNSREIFIYRHHNAKANSPLVILFDGKAYQRKTPTPQILDNLIAAKKIPPVNAVFINNPSRRARGVELPPNPKFAQFMVQELRPKLTKLGLTATAENTILSGSSYGGLASMYVAFSHPELFGNVLSQSGSFWWAPRTGSKEVTEAQWLTRRIASSPAKPVRVYLNAGVFETGFFTIDILESNRHLRDVLKAKEYDVKHHEFSGGHDSYVWRNELASGLIHLLSREGSL